MLLYLKANSSEAQTAEREIPMIHDKIVNLRATKEKEEDVGLVILQGTGNNCLLVQGPCS